MNELTDTPTAKLFSFITHHNPAITSLLLMLESSAHKIKTIYDLKYSNKDEMKVIGGTAMLLKSKITELIILGIAKVTEDAIWNIHDLEISEKIDFWKCNHIKFFKSVKLIRHVANIVKHHRSLVLDNKSQSRDMQEVIKDYGFHPSYDISSYFHDNNYENLYKSIYYTDLFCINLVCSKLNLTKFIPKEIQDDMIVDHLKNRYLEEYINLGLIEKTNNKKSAAEE